jgi:hypothetical protein
MGATVTPIDDPTAATLIDAEQPELRPVEAVTAYLETVHLIADEREWAKRRAELFTMLDGGTVEAVATWLTEHRVVFPGFEREVAAKVISLITGRTEPQTIASTVKPSRPNAAKRTREVERAPLVFPEPIYAEPLTQQLALF